MSLRQGIVQLKRHHGVALRLLVQAVWHRTRVIGQLNNVTIGESGISGRIVWILTERLLEIADRRACACAQTWSSSLVRINCALMCRRFVASRTLHSRR